MKDIEDPAAAAVACYEGAVIYAVTFILSIGYWMIYDMGQGKGFFSSRGNSSSGGGNSRSNEKKKFGSKYGAVATI